jgi:hypothetical protein
MEEIQSLVDISDIQNATGWSPVGSLHCRSSRENGEYSQTRQRRFQRAAVDAARAVLGIP